MPAIGADIPVPDAIEDLLGTRVARLPAPVRTLLLAVALSADLRVGRARRRSPTGRRSTTPSTPALLLVDGERVRASHPLLAAVARKRARPSERRELHRALADAVADEELRALHLALATDGPDAELAATVAAAAAGASARGASGRGGGARRARAAPDAGRRR